MPKKFFAIVLLWLFIADAEARTIESVVEDITWDLLFVVRPTTAQPDIPTDTIILFANDILTPSLASTHFKKCRVNKKQLKLLESKLREYVGVKITTRVAEDARPIWLGEGYGSTFVFGEHMFENGKSLRDLLLETNAGTDASEKSPEFWWKKPRCMDNKRER
jgi:hypothetical protein